MTWFPKKAFRGALVMLVLSAAPTLSAAPAPQKGIDAETVTAYEKLGAVYGGLVKQDFGTKFEAGRDPAESGLPAGRTHDPGKATQSR
jgi:hypothetical protein